ncbi:MAG: hypothetical protein RIR20_719 [Pseudomonadota bacterium]|jgi:hypothetical protein
MAILIDVNTVSKVFNVSDAEHHKFKPVRDWVIDSKGKIIYGGKTYLKEISLLKKYNNLLTQLKIARKVIVFNSALVDSKEKQIKDMLKARGISKTDVRYNDSHIVAILAVTKCRLLCTADKHSHSFIKDASFYEKSTDRPKIYSDGKHSSLLLDC